MKLREDQASGATLIALALFVAWQDRAYPFGTLQEPGPGYTPLLIAIFIGVIGLIIVLRGGASPRLADMKWPEGTRAIVILAACGVATYALEPIGYRLTIVALLVFFIGVLERRPPIMAAAVSVGFSLVSYYLLASLLRVPLPVGPGGW